MPEVAISWLEHVRPIGLVVLAALLGGVVGLERELAGKAAGLRTHMLVAASAAMLMLVGTAVVDLFQKEESDQLIRVDPLRVIEAIIVGISFLGAGTIANERGKGIEGLTTAASVLLTAAIGMAVVVGEIALAAAVTVLAFVVLYLLGLAEYLVETIRARRKKLEQSLSESASEAVEGKPD